MNSASKSSSISSLSTRSAPPLVGPHSPSTLTSICRKWRELALATPKLWRSISLLSNFDQRQTSFPQGVIVDMWLSRSRCCPLSLSIDDYSDGVYDHLSRTDIIPLLVPHRARWEHLNLRLITRDGFIQGAMPLLRHLNLTGSNNPVILAPHDVPQLRTVVLSGAVVAKVTLLWAQLTCLTLRFALLSQCVPILLQAPNLVRCELWNVQETLDSDPYPDITLPHLELFVLKDHTVPGMMSGLLGACIVPALRTLEVTDQFFGRNSIESLKSFVSTSGCQLQEIRITTNADPNNFRETLRAAFPSIPNVFFIDKSRISWTWPSLHH
ncbi:F-box domain-containing protein [Mycena sanguinolenta]|uniref:F-box domain-containing protein n=1 Tax=Mycena sanguinolenta TaxID=230812 RepID=A0A8H7D4K0_9AGAR|nr:F-box domain-containing protein [Mycena sanguinolenta]